MSSPTEPAPMIKTWNLDLSLGAAMGEVCQVLQIISGSKTDGSKAA